MLNKTSSKLLKIISFILILLLFSVIVFGYIEQDFKTEYYDRRNYIYEDMEDGQLPNFSASSGSQTVDANGTISGTYCLNLTGGYRHRIDLPIEMFNITFSVKIKSVGKKSFGVSLPYYNETDTSVYDGPEVTFISNGSIRYVNPYYSGPGSYSKYFSISNWSEGSIYQINFSNVTFDIPYGNFDVTLKNTTYTETMNVPFNCNNWDRFEYLCLYFDDTDNTIFVDDWTIGLVLEFVEIDGGLNQTNVFDSNPTFNWTFLYNISKYQLQIANDSEFTDIFINITNINEYEFSSYYSEIQNTTVSFILPPGYSLPSYNRYYIRIRAYEK